MSELCARAAESKKAKDILVLDVGHILGIAQYFVVCSGRSDRQVKAIADSISREARSISIKPISVEGMRQAEWILIDYGTVVVHVFLEDSRQFYRIERLFKDADRIDWNSEEEKVG